MAVCEPQGEKNPRGRSPSTLWLAALPRASFARVLWFPGSQSIHDCSVQCLGTFLPQAPHRAAAHTDTAASRVLVSPQGCPSASNSALLGLWAGFQTSKGSDSLLMLRKLLFCESRGVRKQCWHSRHLRLRQETSISKYLYFFSN